MCGVAWGSVVELMVLRRAVRGVCLCRGVCVCVCMGRVASVASVARQWGSGWFCKTEEDGMGT